MTLAPVETVRIDEEGKQHLISAKRRTGHEELECLVPLGTLRITGGGHRTCPLDGASHHGRGDDLVHLRRQAR